MDLNPSAYACGLKLRARHPTGRYACLANPCFRLAVDTAFSLRYACSNFFCATLEKTAYAEPLHPTQLPPLIIATVAFSLQFSKNFPDSPKGFFAHGHSKSRSLREKNIAAFSYPYAQKPFKDEKSCKNPARLFAGGKPPVPQKTEGGKVALSSHFL